MDKVWSWIKCAFWWCVDLFRERYQIIVSFNREYGDADDKTYIAKKIYKQTEKHLKFKDEDGCMVEFRSSGGLHYIIKEI
mgnify:CR=1 FL=1|jgi:hypothetical protein